MARSQIASAKSVLEQARSLRERLREDMRLQRWGNDDIQMDQYNNLVKQALIMFPTDPVIGAMVLMPDKILQTYAHPIGELIGATPATMPNDMPCRRTEERINELIGRLEFILEEPVKASTQGRSAKDVLSGEQDADVQAIIQSLRDLRREQEVPTLEHRGFEFVQDERIREVLAQDYVEAQKAFAAGAYKACAVLTAGVIEGMLLDKLFQPNTGETEAYEKAVRKFPKTGEDINWDRVSLAHMIGAADTLQLLDKGTLRMAEGARDFRDTTHPRAEIRHGSRARLEEAELMLALAKLLYRDLGSD